MSQETKVLLGIGIVTAAVFGGIIYFNAKTGSQGVDTPIDQALLAPDDALQTGPKDAKVTIVEFADFQCPACGQSHPITKQIREDYKGRVNMVFRHFPLETIHKNAFISSLAAEAASSQGKFWEMHDKLFENQVSWEANDKPLDLFVGYAQEIGLDVEKFKDSVNKKEFEEKVRKDQRQGSQLGVDRTPTMYFNGKKLSGIPGYAELKTKIEEALKEN